MSRPRRIVPGYVEVCSRTLERRLALVPVSAVKQLMLYVYGYAAQKYDVSLHCMCVMGNHFHLLVNDRHARLPNFMALANGLVARALNARYQRDDKFWSADPYGALRPADAEDLIRRYIYILTNPSAAGLVRFNREYPGVWSGPKVIGKTIRVQRPTFFFSEDGDMPDFVDVCFEFPEVVAADGREFFLGEIESRIRDAELQHVKERRDAGRSVVGVAKLRQMRWWETPDSDNRWFGLAPAIASHDVEVRVAAIRELRCFRRAYRQAWEKWRDGETDVEFPWGAWWMPRYAHARCREPG